MWATLFSVIKAVAKRHFAMRRFAQGDNGRAALDCRTFSPMAGMRASSLRGAKRRSNPEKCVASLCLRPYRTYSGTASAPGLLRFARNDEGGAPPCVLEAFVSSFWVSLGVILSRRRRIFPSAFPGVKILRFAQNDTTPFRYTLYCERSEAIQSTR